jgi:hypothetical protein
MKKAFLLMAVSVPMAAMAVMVTTAVMVGQEARLAEAHTMLRKIPPTKLELAYRSLSLYGSSLLILSY